MIPDSDDVTVVYGQSVEQGVRWVVHRFSTRRLPRLQYVIRATVIVSGRLSAS